MSHDGAARDLVGYARACAAHEVCGGTAPPVPDNAVMSEVHGVFVTLNLHPSGDLRGCIGYPYPVLTLADAVDGAARAACHDPRFADLSPEELDTITVEVTVLTVPRRMVADGPADIPGRIVIGRDGLILECMGRRGLLLPQVPLEQGWDADEYLGHLSMKAGLPPSAWTWSGTELYTFEGKIYREVMPHGDTEEV